MPGDKVGFVKKKDLKELERILKGLERIYKDLERIQKDLPVAYINPPRGAYAFPLLDLVCLAPI